MSKQRVEIDSGETLIETVPGVSKYSVEENITLIAYAEDTTVKASGTTINNKGVMTVSGAVHPSESSGRIFAMQPQGVLAAV